jgi:hypothetical protein
MSPFEGFSEAARLYAEYASVVTLMRERFQTDVYSFLDALQVELAAQLNPVRLNTQITQPPTRFRYWIAGDGVDLKDRDYYPLVFVDPRLPEIVVPGRLDLIGAAPKSTVEQRAQVLKAIEEPYFDKYVVQKSQNTWSLFRFAVTYDHANDLSLIAAPIAELLRRLEPLGSFKPSD